MISTMHGKANNIKMGEEYNPNFLTKYIPYLETNNFYDWAMSKPLQTHGFKWMIKRELKNWRKYPCILEVDLKYPKHLHSLHNYHPLPPEIAHY